MSTEMGKKLSPVEASAYEALDRLLFREWDPIGVSDTEDAEGEYRRYLPEFWRLIKEDALGDAAAYLHTIEVDRITLETSAEHRLDIAKKAAALLSAWRMPVRR